MSKVLRRLLASLLAGAILWILWLIFVGTVLTTQRWQWMVSPAVLVSLGCFSVFVVVATTLSDRTAAVVWKALRRLLASLLAGAILWILWCSMSAAAFIEWGVIIVAVLALALLAFQDTSGSSGGYIVVNCKSCGHSMDVTDAMRNINLGWAAVPCCYHCGAYWANIEYDPEYFAQLKKQEATRERWSRPSYRIAVLLARIMLVLLIIALALGLWVNGGHLPLLHTAWTSRLGRLSLPS
jgi:hypothetical protein